MAIHNVKSFCMQRIKLSLNVLESKTQTPREHIVLWWHKVVENHRYIHDRRDDMTLWKKWCQYKLIRRTNYMSKIFNPNKFMLMVFINTTYHLLLSLQFSNWMGFLLFVDDMEVRRLNTLCQVEDQIMYVIEFRHLRVSQHRNEDPWRTCPGCGCDTLPQIF